MSSPLYALLLHCSPPRRLFSIQGLAQPTPALVSTNRQARFVHAYGQWHLLRLLLQPRHVLRLEKGGGQRRPKKAGAGGRVPRSVARGTNQDLKGNGEHPLHLFSSSNQETPKLLVPSMYLVRTRHSSNCGGTAAQTKLHSLKHEPCNSSRLGSTKSFL